MFGNSLLRYYILFSMSSLLTLNEITKFRDLYDYQVSVKYRWILHKVVRWQLVPLHIGIQFQENLKEQYQRKVKMA